MTVDLHLIKIAPPYRLSETDAVVRVMRWRYDAMTGAEMPFAGMRLSADAAQLANNGGIPAVYRGLDSERGHATPHYARLSEITRGTKVMLMAALHLLAWASRRDFRARYSPWNGPGLSPPQFVC